MGRRRALRRRYGRSYGSGGFASWADVMAAARAGETLFYKAPLDTYAYGFEPALSSAPSPRTYRVKGRTIRMWPPGSVGRGRMRTSDPFTADAGHLSRLSRNS